MEYENYDGSDKRTAQRSEPDFTQGESKQSVADRWARQIGSASGLDTAVGKILWPTPEGSKGLKNDDGKSRIDLIDSEWLEGVGHVLRFGANKYSVYGKCDCILSSSTKNGMQKIANGKTPINDNTWQTIRNNEKENGREICVDGSELRGRSSSRFWPSQAVESAEAQKNCALTTATQQETFEEDSVKDVTSPSDSWKERNGARKHEPTCSSLQLLRTGAHNWRGGIHVSRLIAGIYRHLGAINRGEDIDPESGQPHIYHLSCGAMFLSWMLKHRSDLDDRYRK